MKWGRRVRKGAEQSSVWRSLAYLRQKSIRSKMLTGVRWLEPKYSLHEDYEQGGIGRHRSVAQPSDGGGNGRQLRKVAAPH